MQMFRFHTHLHNTATPSTQISIQHYTQRQSQWGDGYIAHKRCVHEILNCENRSRPSEPHRHRYTPSFSISIPSHFIPQFSLHRIANFTAPAGCEYHQIDTALQKSPRTASLRLGLLFLILNVSSRTIDVTHVLHEGKPHDHAPPVLYRTRSIYPAPSIYKYSLLERNVADFAELVFCVVFAFIRTNRTYQHYTYSIYS